MTELLTAAQMRAIEQAAIDSGKVTGLELMERAGRGVVEAIFGEWPELKKTSHRAVVLCGPGNNGGDGFVVARLLKEWGWEVEVFLYGDPDKLPPDARTNYERLQGKTGKVASLQEFDALDCFADIAIDALFGTGLSRPMEQIVGESVFGFGYSKNVVAVDISSGTCADSGQFLGIACDEVGGPFPSRTADLTVTFQYRKIGHFLGAGPDLSGKIKCVDIGVGSPSVTSVSLIGAPLSPGQNWRAITPILKNRDFSHKYEHGHALILSGGPGKTGAARLAARGALRIGAGLVTLGCPKASLPEIAAQVTAIMARPLDGAPGLSELLEDERFNALCLGPGLGLGVDTQALVLAALGGAGVEPRPTVLDADALSRFERKPDVLFEALHKDCVLTPHAGEFKRLFPDIADKLNAPATTGPAYSKVDATREAAKRAGCTVLFKGPDTVIADQTGRCSINSSAYERSAPWLATAGSGDVLAGFITGLLARGFSPMDAAESGAWLHTECALKFGPGLIAEDLPEQLPAVFRDLSL